MNQSELAIIYFRLPTLIFLPFFFSLINHIAIRCTYRWLLVLLFFTWCHLLSLSLSRCCTLRYYHTTFGGEWCIQVYAKIVYEAIPTTPDARAFLFRPVRSFAYAYMCRNIREYISRDEKQRGLFQPFFCTLWTLCFRCSFILSKPVFRHLRYTDICWLSFYSMLHVQPVFLYNSWFYLVNRRNNFTFLFLYNFQFFKYLR